VRLRTRPLQNTSSASDLLPTPGPLPAEASAQADRQAALPARRDDLDRLIEKFLISQDIKSSSKTTYRRGLRNFFAWLSTFPPLQGEGRGVDGLRGPTRDTILAYKTHLEDLRGSPLTLSTYLTSVRRFFEWAESMKYYPNVAKGIRGSKRMKGFRKQCLTVPQAKRLLLFPEKSPPLQGEGEGGDGVHSIEDLRDRAIVNLMVRTGLRTIEVIRADVEDLRQEGGEAVLWIQGKGRDAKDDFVLLTEENLGPIREYLAQRKSPPLQGEGKGRDGGEPLFTSLSGRNRDGRLTTRSIRRMVKHRLGQIGLVSKRLTAHSLRHTAITLSLLGGASIQEAKVMARHASVDTTLIYAHNISRIANAPERRIDHVLAGA